MKRSKLVGAGLRGAVLAFLVFMIHPVRADQASTYVVNWAPDRYKVHCNNNNPAVDCMPASFRVQVASYLRELSGIYKAIGWKAVGNFGPVATEPGKPPYIRVLDTDQDMYAYANLYCSGTTDISYGKKTREIQSRAHMVYYFFAHELFHVIQAASPALGPCTPKTNHGWVMEGTAAEYGMHLTRKKFPHLFPLRAPSTAGQPGIDVPAAVPAEMMVREVKADAGGRSYDVPLHQGFVNADGTPQETGALALQHYQTSSFWRHLSEVYHGGSLTYLYHYFQHKAVNSDWSKWLSDNLQRDPQIAAALGPVFAMFVADYAGWGDPRRPGAYFGPAKWLELGFTKCAQVTLSAASPAHALVTTAEETAARCIKVKVEGVAPGQRVAVNVAAFADNKAQVDQLNVGLAQSTDKRGFHCANALRAADYETRLRARTRCLMLGYTGETTMDNKRAWYRIWDVFPQYGLAGSFENTYIVSRISTAPSDRSFSRPGQGGKVMKFGMLFVADFATKKIDGVDSGRSVVAHVNAEPIFNAQEQVPRHNHQGGPAMPIVWPHAPTDLVVPKVAAALGKGIWVIRMTDVTVQDDGLYSEILGAASALAIYPATADGKSHRPLEIGDHGTYKAEVNGLVGRTAMRTETPATLEVLEFSPRVLRATVRGTLCEASLNPRDRAAGCRNPRQVELTISKAFAALHHPSSRFVIEDTPGTRQLRAMVSRVMDLMLDAKAGTPPPDESRIQPTTPPATPATAAPPTMSSTVPGMPPVTGPFDSTIHRVGKCDCTCNDQHYLHQLGVDLKSGKQRESPAMLKQVMAIGRCMRSCTPHYVTTCKNKSKP